LAADVLGHTLVSHGTNDELVPTTGVTLNVKRLQDLGYRYRYSLFPAKSTTGRRSPTSGPRVPTKRAVEGKVSTGSQLVLTLLGRWPASLTAEVDGAPVAFERSSGAIVLRIPSGRHTVRLVP
jgi:hypothetical protein